jgi:hypothetical protein
VKTVKRIVRAKDPRLCATGFLACVVLKTKFSKLPKGFATNRKTTLCMVASGS